ncbi:hypothetical protein EDD52_11619 [Primorskyibacter sedentarius]|uniref:Uncharacterized protein n=1 Tax=Primorskyibacter sedentarius TaxID=745311 RepID=A0A4R3J2I0_9RHOB|nr:hypothetical protein EDD52_11619 [Primorskyibacter sedentarius]
MSVWIELQFGEMLGLLLGYEISQYHCVIKGQSFWEKGRDAATFVVDIKERLRQWVNPIGI